MPIFATRSWEREAGRDARDGADNAEGGAGAPPPKGDQPMAFIWSTSASMSGRVPASGVISA